MGRSPTIAICTACGRQFKAPLTRVRKVTDAMGSLQEQFERHICSRITPAAVEGRWVEGKFIANYSDQSREMYGGSAFGDVFT